LTADAMTVTVCDSVYKAVDEWLWQRCC